jgi:hypothetical protein
MKPYVPEHEQAIPAGLLTNVYLYAVLGPAEKVEAGDQVEAGGRLILMEQGNPAILKGTPAGAYAGRVFRKVAVIGTEDHAAVEAKFYR